MPLLEKSNSRTFATLLGLSATSIAFMAAFFSVSGLAMVYAGSSLLVAIAMGVLEFSKLVTASFLYRYWQDITFKMKSYLVLAVIILMVITSGGIYGYLTNAYQGATISLDKINSEMLLLEDQEKILIEDRDRFISDRQKLLEIRNQDISGITMTDSTRYYDSRVRQRAYERYEGELSAINENLDSTNVQLSRIRGKIADNKTKMIDTGVEVGPLVYMARVFNTSMDTVMNWFSLFIVVVFDPLAVVLVIAFNFVLVKMREDKLAYLREVEREKEAERKRQEKERQDRERKERLEKERKEREDKEREERDKRNISIDFRDVIRKVTGQSSKSEKPKPPTIPEEEKQDEVVSDLVQEAVKGEEPKKVDKTKKKMEQKSKSKVKKVDSSLTDDEIINSFEDASRQARLSGSGRRVVYEPGGGVDIDYSIQED